MPLSLESIKADFARNRKKGALLASLFAVMLILFLRAYLVTGAKPAAASSTFFDPHAPDAHPAPADAAAATNADARLRLSHDLWKTLRDVRGTPPASVFKFDPSLFPLDPNRPRPVVVDVPQGDTAVHAAPRIVYDEDAEKRARILAVHDQARALIVRSTVVNTGAHPVAVINDRILTVGDHINGFEITAIRAREVEFKKDDVTLPIKMVDMPRGQ
jgi:hypothetical protein